MSNEFAHPDLGDVELDAVLAALADPHRRRVVVELAAEPERERTCASFNLPVARSTRTHHWRVLREAGLVHQRAAGNTSYLLLRRTEIDDRFPGLLDTVVSLTGATAR
ncbi:ArsR/SmtB family transcription factor [Amycolatopsis suaedae]|uniref:ArsR/SmtB family transcription factor n=1 Tax=Amycolatopsis suaedae TaxID=2510978 RepID=UPI001F0ED5D9|nr:helix-turn-helix transcriptional regulator [Amycolatopsis suaedae]